jgi:hypothetical protein
MVCCWEGTLLCELTGSNLQNFQKGRRQKTQKDKQKTRRPLFVFFSPFFSFFHEDSWHFLVVVVVEDPGKS